MVTLKIANTMEDIGLVFENKKECEKYLSRCNFMKISDDKWICKPTRGNSKSYFPIILVIEDAKENYYFMENSVQCNKCIHYEGVHNVQGHAPCTFWNKGGVLWNDSCWAWENYINFRENDKDFRKKNGEVKID